MDNPFDIFLTSRVSIRKRDGSVSNEIPAAVKAGRIEIHDTTVDVAAGDFAVRHLPNGKEEIYEVGSVDFEEGFAGHIPASIVLNCRRRDPMPVFGSHTSVTIVRAPGLPDEKRWPAQMGGDLNRKALFYVDDRVKTGDEIHCDVFDEPRVIARVNPSLTHSGVSHWEAEMVPQSEWRRRQSASLPSITVTGQGARVNLNSVDQSVQHFHNHPASQAAVLRVLEEIRQALPAHIPSPVERADTAIDLDQIKLEIQRSKPDKGRIWTLVDRLGALAGLAEKAANLGQLLQQLGLGM